MNDYPNSFLEFKGLYLSHDGAHYSKNWTPEKQKSYNQWYYERNKHAINEQRRLKKRSKLASERYGELEDQSKTYYDKANAELAKGDKVKEQQFYDNVKIFFDPVRDNSEIAKNNKRAEHQYKTHYERAAKLYTKAGDSKVKASNMGKKARKVTVEYTKKSNDIKDDKAKLSNKAKYTGYAAGVLVRNIGGSISNAGANFINKIIKKK